MRDQIANIARAVADSHQLTGHGKRTFEKMAGEVFAKVEPLIAEQIAAGTVARVKAERDRLGQVLELPECKGRETAAHRLALQSDMTVEQITGILASTPRPRTGPSALSQAMRGNSPGISADAGEYDDDLDECEKAARYILNVTQEVAS